MSDRAAAPHVSVRPIGGEGEVLARIDDLSPDPAGLRAAAAAATFGAAGQHYPGIRAALPDAYLDEAMPVLRQAAAQAFGARGLRLVDASFSIVTAAPDALSVPQRVPHCDAFTRDRLALIHYVSPEGAMGGTAFYRHRSTGFETVDTARRARFFDTLSQEVARDPPAGYIAGDTPLFQRIALGEAAFNRAYLYRSWQLHSGVIAPGAVLDPDPARGRLTVTAFFSAA